MGKTNEAAAAEKEAENYLLGRNILPAWAYTKKHYPYIYATQKSVTQNVPAVLPIVIEPDAAFLVESIQIVPGTTFGAYEDVSVQIFDTSHAAPWSNAAVNLRDLAGKGDSPKYLADPILVFPSATIEVRITSALATQTFYVALQGRKIYGLTELETTFLMKRMWFQYVMTLPTMTDGQVNRPVTLNIMNESDFLIKKLYSSDIIQFVMNTATAGTESKEIMMQLKDAASDQNFFSQSLAARLVVGSQFDPYTSGGASFTNGEGFVLRKPIFIRRSGSIIGTFANKSTTTATGLRLTLEGCRIFS